MNEGMDVNSPENGFDDINDYLNNEDSTFADDLDLDYIVNKDIAEDYMYGDLPVNEKIHLDLSEQQRRELPILSSSFRYYDIPGSPSQNLYSSLQSEFHTGTLGRCEIVGEQGKLQIQSNENLHHNDAERVSRGYFCGSIFHVDSDSVLDEIQNDASRQPQEVVSIQDANLQAILDKPASSFHNEIGEHTCTKALKNKCVRRDAHEEVSVHQTQNSCFSPGSRLRWDIEITGELMNEARILPSGCKEFEPPNFDQKNHGNFPELYRISNTNGEMPGSPNHSDTVYHSPGIHELSATQPDQQIVSNSASSGKWTLSSIESNRCEVFPSENLVLNADQLTPASPRGLKQKSQQVANSPAEHVTTSLRQTGRPISLSYVRRNKSFSRHKMHGRNQFHASSPLHTGDFSQRSLKSSLSAPQHQLPNEEVVQQSYSTRSCNQKHEPNKMSDYRRYRTRSPYAKNCKKKSFEVTPACWSLKSKKAPPAQESVPQMPYSSRSLNQKRELSETAMQKGSESRSQRNKAASLRSLMQKPGSTDNCKRKRSRSRSSYTDELRKRSMKSSSYTHQSPSSQKVSMSGESLLQPSSSKPWKQKNEPNERSNMGERVVSSNSVGFRHSSSPGNSTQKPIDSYSAKQSPASPKNHCTHHHHGCRGRSISPSWFKQKDLSSDYKGGICNKSRQRSPYRRDIGTRTPRTRRSPRRKSPLPRYPSLRNSPRRAHWSPRNDRSTGIGKPGRNLFIAGFSFLTTERDLKRKFSEFGRVQDVRILRDKRSGDSRGFGFLSLDRDEQADAAIRALDKTEWNGRIILVEKSKPH